MVVNRFFNFPLETKQKLASRDTKQTGSEVRRTPASIPKLSKNPQTLTKIWLQGKFFFQNFPVFVRCLQCCLSERPWLLGCAKIKPHHMDISEQ